MRTTILCLLLILGFTRTFAGTCRPDCTVIENTEELHCTGDRCPLRMSLTGSAKHAVVDAVFTLICTISNAEHVSLDQSIVMHNSTYPGIGNLYFGEWIQVRSYCRVRSYVGSEYSFECGEGTNEEYSTVKKYHMTIKPVKHYHDEMWRCDLTSLGPSGYFRLKVHDH